MIELGPKVTHHVYGESDMLPKVHSLQASKENPIFYIFQLLLDDQRFLQVLIA